MVEQNIHLNEHSTLSPEKLVDIIGVKAGKSNPAYSSDIPLASQTSLDATINALTDPSNAMHLTSFTNLLAQVGIQNINSPMWSDPLTPLFWKGEIETGSVVQNIVIPRMKARGYRFDDSQSVFQISEPDMTEYFSTLNRKDVTPLTLAPNEMRKALRSPNGVSEFYERIMGALTASVEMDNTNYVLRSLGGAIKNGHVTYVEVGDATTQDELKSAISQMRKVAREMKFPSTSVKYNKAHLEFPTKTSDLITLVNLGFQSDAEVNVFSEAFNRDDVQLFGKRVEVPQFEFDNDGNVLALMMDKEFFQIYGYLNEIASNNNAATLTEHIYRHIWNSYTTISAFNAVAFVKHLPKGVPGFSLIPDRNVLTSTPAKLGKSVNFKADGLQVGEKLVVRVKQDSSKLVTVVVNGDDTETPGAVIDGGTQVVPRADGTFTAHIKYNDLKTLSSLGQPAKVELIFNTYTTDKSIDTKASDDYIVTFNIYPNEPTTMNGDFL